MQVTTLILIYLSSLMRMVGEAIP